MTLFYLGVTALIIGSISLYLYEKNKTGICLVAGIFAIAFGSVAFLLPLNI